MLILLDNSALRSYKDNIVYEGDLDLFSYNAIY